MKKVMMFLSILSISIYSCSGQWPEPDVSGYTDSLVKVIVDSTVTVKVDSMQTIVDSVDFEVVKTKAEVTSLNETILSLNTLVDSLSQRIQLDGDGTAEVNSDSSYFRLKREGENLWLTVSDKINDEKRITFFVVDNLLQLWNGQGNVSHLQFSLKLNN